MRRVIDWYKREKKINPYLPTMIMLPIILVLNVISLVLVVLGRK